MLSTTGRTSRFLRQSTGSRRRTTQWALIAAVAAIGLTGATAVPAIAASYSITDLGSLGYPTARAAAINEAGQVTGTSYLAESVEYNRGCSPKHRPCHVHPEHPFLYSGGKMTDLGTLGGLFAEGAAINTSGDVAPADAFIPRHCARPGTMACP
jgi:hypothetical protein